MNKNFYITLAVLGLFLPYAFLFLFVMENGLYLRLLLEQLFANRISAFFAVELAITIVTFGFYVQAEARKLHMKNWGLFILASMTIGLSFAFPLFLYFRRRRREHIREKVKLMKEIKNVDV